MSNIEDLAKSIVAGTATEQDQGVALKALQNAMASSLISGLRTLDNTVVRLIGVSERLFDQLNTRMEVDVQNMQMNEVLRWIQTIQNNQIQILDLYRKVVQGRELFPSDTFSDEEKLVLQLMKSFRSQEDKQKFLDICKDFLANGNS